MSRRGFSLIEALVALAIASMCLLAIFGLQIEIVAAQRRYEAAVTRAEARRNILALVRDLNPEAQPRGTTDLPDGEKLSWDSRPAGPVRRVLTLAGQPTAFEVRLSLVEARLLDRAGAAKDVVSVERMGWRRTAPPRPPPTGQGVTPPAPSRP